MKIYKHRIFDKWAKSEDISNSLLKEAINEIEQGLFEANLGGGLYKKRIPRKGQGKSSGYRTFIAFKQGNRAIFVFGFAKNEIENISEIQLENLKISGRYYLLASVDEIKNAVRNNKLIEVHDA